jgi:hypothetical protein
MLKRCTATMLYAALAVATLTSCGGDKAGGTGEFATVFAIATPPAGPIDSDVAHWVDAAGATAPPCTATSFPSVLPDNVTYTITSTPYTVPNTGQSSPIVTSDLVVSRITLTLNPANTQTPVLPPVFQTQFLSSGQLIVPGSNSVSVQIASDQLKDFLRTGLGSQSITCSNQPIFTYRATVSFEMLEVTTNRVSTVTAPGFLLVNFTDFIDK